MKPINLNSRLSHLEHRYSDIRNGLFIGSVEFVDYEKKQLAIRDLASDILYERVDIFPATGSSYTQTDLTMPEVGAIGICGVISNNGGFIRIGVIQWSVSNTLTGLNTVGYRGFINPKGQNLRKRGIYRKTYPGQKTATLTEGFSEVQDAGWDRQSNELSRDKLNIFSRTRSMVSGTHVFYDESGLSLSGLVDREFDTSLMETKLPDGTSKRYVYLNNSSKSRFIDGLDNSIPLVERLSKVHEFGLDFPVPLELVRSKLLDQILGSTANPFDRTKVNTNGDFSVDDQTGIDTQDTDHPYDVDTAPTGSATNDCTSYRRKGYIIEKSEGTLVGSNPWDNLTYGKVLKPVIFPYTSDGRFGTSVESSYLPVNQSQDQVETLLAASAFSIRFPYEYNTTRLDITKEGLTLIELGSTIPKENISIDGSTYEHPYGAGRSLELHAVGSARMVLGKNRDEEESLDLTTLGQVVMRLGSDDSSLPNDRRHVLTQSRYQNDSIQYRKFQYWNTPKLEAGDSGPLDNKRGAEGVSLRAAFDGGTVLRLGARNPNALRKHLYNGYKDGQGLNQYGLSDPSRKDSRTDGRPIYGSGDSVYAFHDLTTAGASQLGLPPYFYSGSSITNMDRHGLSLDIHAVRDILLRAGANPESGVSVSIDLGGGLVAMISKDNKGRSITATLDGGGEIVIGTNNEGRSLQLELNGDVNIVCKGNWHQYVTGDYYIESTNKTEVTKVENVIKAMNIRQAAMVQHVTEAPDIVNNQGLYKS